MRITHRKGAAAMMDKQWIEIARLLRAEHDGEGVDLGRMHQMARDLLDGFPDMQVTLRSIIHRTMPFQSQRRDGVSC